jgi:hypothetical protein
MSTSETVLPQQGSPDMASIFLKTLAAAPAGAGLTALVCGVGILVGCPLVSLGTVCLLASDLNEDEDED